MRREQLVECLVEPEEPVVAIGSVSSSINQGGGKWRGAVIARWRAAPTARRVRAVTLSRKPSRSIRPLTISRDRVLAPLPGALVPVARQNNVMRAASSSAAIV
jgi:hypothetical protein